MLEQLNQQILNRRLWLLIVSMVLNGTSYADITGRVVGVSDGDTITVLVDEYQPVKVRLDQIDAPEKKQPFGKASKKHLSDLVFDKQVSVIGDKKDKYQRLIGTVFVDNVNANIEQLKAGMAWVYTQYLRDPVLLEYQAAAQQTHMGLWQENNPIAPWEFRHAPKQQTVVLSPTAEDIFEADEF